MSIDWAEDVRRSPLNLRRPLKLAVGLSLVLVVSTPVFAFKSPDFVQSETELRLRRQTALSILADTADGADNEEKGYGDEYHFRLRAGIVADWDRDISLASTIQVQGVWDDDDRDADADFGLAELYFDFRNIGFLPLSSKLGRQRLLHGRGILISDEDHEWYFDALDFNYGTFPSTLRLLAARRAHVSPVTPLEWIGLLSLKYEPQTPYLRESEIYGGAVLTENSRLFFPVGVRLEMMLSPEIEAWTELVFQGGNSLEQKSVRAMLADAGLVYSPPWTRFEPAVHARATYASGTGDKDRSDFVPMMDHGIGGIVLRPRLTNVQVYESSASFEPLERAKIECSFYRYLRNSATEGLVGRSGWVYDGLTAPTGAQSRDLGWEANLSLQWRASEDLSFRFIAGIFGFGPAFDTVKENEVIEGWLEVVWRY